MSIRGLEDYSKDQLIEELINRTTFAGIVIFHRGDAKAGTLEPGETVITKSPPLSRDEVERMLRVGQSLVPRMFGDVASAACCQLGVPLPEFLTADKFGYVRVAGHRIGLDQLVDYYNEGYSAETLASEFPTLPLSLIYHCFAFYLDHRKEVDRYVAACRAASDERRRASKGGPGLQQLRDRLAAAQAPERK